jgi:hypothetical protein
MARIQDMSSDICSGITLHHARTLTHHLERSQYDARLRDREYAQKPQERDDKIARYQSRIDGYRSRIPSYRTRARQNDVLYREQTEILKMEGEELARLRKEKLVVGEKLGMVVRMGGKGGELRRGLQEGYERFLGEKEWEVEGLKGEVGEKNGVIRSLEMRLGEVEEMVGELREKEECWRARLWEEEGMRERLIGEKDRVIEEERVCLEFEGGG